MRVLVGFEESGTVRDAFAARGHDAWSCDLQPSRAGGQHYTADIWEALKAQPWDLVVLHPPCTALCVAGNRHYGEGQPKHAERLAAMEFVRSLW
jgi:hypothetical protein